LKTFCIDVDKRYRAVAVKVTKNGDRKYHGIFCCKRAVTFFLDINPLDATSLCKRNLLKYKAITN